MSALSTRLRFLACRQLELALSGMFPKAEVLPFGSSVNSFGKPASDLDMAVTLDGGVDVPSSSDSRLIFHAKSAANGHRLQVQRYGEFFFGALKNLLPGCQNVHNISLARVPIVKYRQHLLNLDCDVSCNSLSGFYMSELLYLFGELDPRVRPLVCAVQNWARRQGLMETARPTTFFTSFTLTLLAVFFLQLECRMLPPIRTLRQLARPQDRRVCEDGTDCTFLRDISGRQSGFNGRLGQADPAAGDLLLAFFRFYGHAFDYRRHAVCVVTGQLQPRRSADRIGGNGSGKQSFFLDVTNPLEPDLNVAANVQEHALQKFQQRCRLSAALLEDSTDEKRSLSALFKNGSGEERRNQTDGGDVEDGRGRLSVLGGWREFGCSDAESADGNRVRELKRQLHVKDDDDVKVVKKVGCRHQAAEGDQEEGSSGCQSPKLLSAEVLAWRADCLPSACEKIHPRNAMQGYEAIE